MLAPIINDCAPNLIEARTSLAAITFDGLPPDTAAAVHAALASLDRLIAVNAALTAAHTQPTISVDQYADIMGVNRITMYDHIKAGAATVPTLRIGRRILIPSAHVLRQLGIGD